MAKNNKKKNENYHFFVTLPYEYIDEIRQELIKKICTEVEPKCAHQAIDLMFLVDSSGSVGETDYIALEFAFDWRKRVSLVVFRPFWSMCSGDLCHFDF